MRGDYLCAAAFTVAVGDFAVRNCCKCPDSGTKSKKGRLSEQKAVAMIMSWFNPSEDEAREEYYYYKRKYNSAYNSLRSSERTEENCISIRSSAQKKAEAAKNEKKNAEKRLKELREILKLMEGGGWGNNAPRAIEENNKVVKNADEGYKKCIRSTDISAASINDAFQTEAVDQNPGSAQALKAFKDEINRLEQSIKELQTKISNETARAEEMRKQINQCNREQSSYRSQMNSATYNMNHYKKYF